MYRVKSKEERVACKVWGVGCADGACCGDDPKMLLVWFVGDRPWPLPAKNGSNSRPTIRVPQRPLWTIVRFQAKWEHLTKFSALLPESQGQNLALIVFCVPYSLDSGGVASHASRRCDLPPHNSSSQKCNLVWNPVECWPHNAYSVFASARHPKASP